MGNRLQNKEEEMRCLLCNGEMEKATVAYTLIEKDIIFLSKKFQLMSVLNVAKNTLKRKK